VVQLVDQQLLALLGAAPLLDLARQFGLAQLLLRHVEGDAADPAGAAVGSALDHRGAGPEPPMPAVAGRHAVFEGRLVVLVQGVQGRVHLDEVVGQHEAAPISHRLVVRR
jgi:hypothetical protein